MSFIDLIRREMHGSMPKLLFMSGLGGVSNASILAAINAGVQDASNGQKPGLWAATLFLVALFLFMKSQEFVTITATAEIEAIIHKLRVRIMDMIRRSELLEVEKIGRSRIVAAVTSDAAVLTQASNMLCFTIQGAVLIFFVGLYVAYLSLAAFLLTFVIVVGAGTIFHYKNKRLAAQKGESAAWERRLYERLTDFLNGFKEVRLNRPRSDDLYADAAEVSMTAANIKIRTQAETFKMIVTSQISMYVLLGAVVFVAPNLSDSLGGTSIAKATTALLFIVGACFGLVQSIPILLNANAAADRIARLEGALETALSAVDPRDITARKHFDKIEMQNIVFRYTDRFSDTVFKIGPIDFTLNSGELVFITGGNGSGKSTFLRAGRPLSAGFRRNLCRRHAHQRQYPRRLSCADVGDLLRLPPVSAALRHRRAGSGRARPPVAEVPARGQDRARQRRIPHARSLRRPAPPPCAHRQHAGKTADNAARRVDRRAGSRISSQIL
jgi:putative pyoverdin transport system ATP-binding/permease protein